MRVWNNKGIVYSSYDDKRGRRSYCQGVEVDIEKWQVFLKEKVPIFILPWKELQAGCLEVAGFLFF